VCVCKGVGKKVYQLRNRLLGVMKIVFPASGTDRKAVLKASCVVIRLQHCSSEPVDGDPAWEDGLVLHIGCMYLSPFRPTFRECELLGEPAENIIRIRGTNTYKVERDIFRTMALDSVRWQVIYYVLRERKLPKMPFDPSIMECIRYTTEAVDSGYEFWPPPQPKKRKRRAPRPPGADAPMEADQAEVEEVHDPQDELAALGAAEEKDEDEEAVLEQAAVAQEAERLNVLFDVQQNEGDEENNASSESSTSSSSGSSSSTSDSDDDSDASSPPPLLAQSGRIA